ncbi:MAG TPA: carboxymuconolactone decarboxylase family protein [Candidatus Methylomirabilis sp.]
MSPTARVPLLADRDRLPPDAQRVYDQIGAKRGGVVGPFQVLLHCPELAGRVGALGQTIRFEGTLPEEVRETAVLAAAREMDCAFEWSAHVGLARAAGVPDRTIAVIAERRGLEALTARERIAVALARESFQRHRISDEVFAAAQTEWGIPGVVELVTTIGYYAMLAMILNAAAVQPAPGAAHLPLP